MNKLPPASYIKKNPTTATMIIRVAPELKKKVVRYSKEYETSQNRICEASIEWYIQELDAQKEKTKIKG